MYAPPVFSLLFSNASNISVMVVFILLSLSGTTAISYCFRFPPKVFTSATPFVPINWGFIIQS